MTEAHIERALASGCRSVADLGARLGAGRGCGQCRRDLAQEVRRGRWRRWLSRLGVR